MTSNTTSTTLPIFQEGDKVKLRSPAELSGRLRCGEDLSKEVPGRSATMHYKAENNQVFTIFKTRLDRTSLAPGQTLENQQAMAMHYRLGYPTDESRFIYEETSLTIPMVLHTSLKKVAGTAAPLARFNRGERVMLTKPLSVQHDGSTRIVHYSIGQVLQIESRPLTTQGNPAAGNVPADKCRYNVTVMARKEVKDIFWKGNYDLTVSSIVAA